MSYQWIIPLVALLAYGALLVVIILRRDWQDVPIRRLAFYLVLAMLAQTAVLVSLGSAGEPGVQVPMDKAYLFTQAALPLFFYAFARPFIRAEQKPWAFLIGLALLIAAIAIDLLQISFDLVTGTLSTTTVVFILQTVLWAFVASILLVYAVTEYARAASPLHRNRLAFLFLALPFFIGHDAADLVGGEAVQPYALILQVVGVSFISYAILRHNLVDLRDLLRTSARNILLTAFGILVYGIALGAALVLLRGVDVRTGLLWAAAAAVVLAVFFQPARDWVELVVQRLLFGRRSDVQAVVQNFSLQLAAQIELNDLAAKGRQLLKQAVGARDAALLLVSKEAEELTLSVVPYAVEGALTIRLGSACSVARALTARDAPLLQYDIDRLPQYADLSAETRAALQGLGGEALMPIRSRGALIGIWVIGVKVSGDRYDHADLDLLTTLAGQSAVALENARLLADLRDQMLRMSAMRDYLDSTLTSIATGVITIDPEGKIASFNRAAQDIFRMAAVDALGREYGQVLPPMEGAQLPLLIARLWAHSSQHLVRDVIAQVPGRGQVHLTLELSGFRRGQEMVGVALVVEDETEQARLEIERRAQEQEMLRVRSTFEHYVAPSVVENLLGDSRRIALGGERQLLTILFADMHGFTKLSEELPPEELVDVLNGYLALASQAILRYEGTLDKFMGDGVMAIFNAPLPQLDHAWRASCAALALQREVAAFAPRLPAAQRLLFRIGLHTGEAVVGNIGTKDLMNYTAVGDTVNIAKRLQENAETGQILMSRATQSLIQDKVVVRPRDRLLLHGREAPIDVFELVGAWEER